MSTDHFGLLRAGGGTKCAWALQTGVKDAITPSAGIPNTSENYLIFETSKHAGVVYWKTVLQSTPEAICHEEFLGFFCQQTMSVSCHVVFFQNVSIMATVATWEKTPWKKPCRGSDVGP